MSRIRPGGVVAKIVWHGHACFEISGSRTVVTDPHDGRSIGIRTPVVRADIVLISHEHFDHNCARIVKGDFVTVRDLGEREIGGVMIRGVPAYHDDVRGEKRGSIVLYRFELDGISFCHLGDLGHDLSEDQIRALAPVDILFLPVGGVFTIDAEIAHRVVERLRPRVAIPMHYRVGGLSLSIHTLEPFLDTVEEERLFGVGNSMEVFPEDLPESTEYWVFCA